MATTGVIGQVWRADVTAAGSVEPWKLKQNYFYDAWKLGRTRFDDGALVFSNPADVPSLTH